jgi:hypothetical protein
MEQSTSFLHPNLLTIFKIVPPAKCPTRTREMESELVSDVESPARRRVNLVLNSPGGGAERADGSPAVAKEDVASGLENEVYGINDNRTECNGSAIASNQSVQGATGYTNAARLEGAVPPIAQQIPPVF